MKPFYPEFQIKVSAYSFGDNNGRVAIIQLDTRVAIIQLDTRMTIIELGDGNISLTQTVEQKLAPLHHPYPLIFSHQILMVLEGINI